MTACDRVRAGAPGLAALPPDDPERLAAWSHARDCEGCARALREAERLQALVGEWEPEAPRPEALARVSREIHARLRREALRGQLAAVAAVCLSGALFAGLARHRSSAPVDLATAALLWALAVVLAATASRRPLLAAGLAVAAAGAVTLASGAPGPVAAATGLECLATELGSAALVVGAVWLALRGGAASPARAALAAAGATGALAGDAALQLTCAAHSSVPHLLAFHVAGLVLAAGLASLLWRAPDRATAG